MVLQLPLLLSLRDDASFENYFTAGNEAVLAQVQRSVNDSFSDGSIFLWGPKGSGKTHVLQAACLEAAHQGLNVAYIPLHEAEELDVKMLDGLEKYNIVCVDDIDIIAGNNEWEQAFFHLYNRTFESGTQLIFSADKSLKECGIALPDLVSRLSWGFVFHLRTLQNEDKPKALQERAKHRGFELSDSVVNYLLKRFPDDINAMFDLLDELDKASLAAQRKLTVPFVKEWFDNKNISESEPDFL